MENGNITEQPTLLPHIDALEIALGEMASLWTALLILNERQCSEALTYNVARIGERISHQAKDELTRLYETWKRSMSSLDQTPQSQEN